MPNKHLFALMLTVTLAASGAVAEVTPGPLDAESRGSASQADAEDNAIRRALEQFRTTQVPLSRAMAIAERLHNGSRTADIMFEVSGSPAYRVRTVKNERVWENVVDANTGKITEKEVVSSLKALDREDLANIIALQWIKQELSDAVQIAEKAALGNALAGGLIKQDGKLSFVIVIASGDQLKEVTLEPPKVPKQGPSRR
jgi:uncharacterized membrane protein YkoI